MNIIKCSFGMTIQSDFTGIAILDEDYTKIYFLNGSFHRHDGPAIERSDGTKYWYLNDCFYTENSFIIVTRLVRIIKRNFK